MWVACLYPLPKWVTDEYLYLTMLITHGLEWQSQHAKSPVFALGWEIWFTARAFLLGNGYADSKLVKAMGSSHCLVISNSKFAWTEGPSDTPWMALVPVLGGECLSQLWEVGSQNTSWKASLYRITSVHYWKISNSGCCFATGKWEH